MVLVTDRHYPDYGTYKGTAYYGRVDLATLRVGIPPIDDFITWLAEQVIEANVAIQGGSMLQMKVWRDPSTWGIVPTYVWRLDFWFHFSLALEAEALAVPVVVWTIVKLVLSAVIAIAIWAAIREVKEIIWPKKEAPIIAYALMLAAIGFAVTPIIVEALRRT